MKAKKPDKSGKKVISPFQLIPPTDTPVPILVSVPHCGTLFPPELESQFTADLVKEPDDTDWFVHRLYDFVPSMGITMVHANYSRWVIDLNRDPESKPLYSDGRILTALCPSTNFLGEALYLDGRAAIEAEEVKRRLGLYYLPYHFQIREKLNELRLLFGKVLLWDCHSIRQVVPTIQKEKFPDLVLGDADGTSASPGLIESVLSVLDHSGYLTSHNHPFKGGFITRHYGKPSENIHALQLEMTKVNYMDDPEKKYNEARASKIRELLKRSFSELITTLS